MHTIGIGVGGQRRERDDKGMLTPAVFLRRLADENSGRHVVAKR